MSTNRPSKSLSRPELARIIWQLQINPEAAPGADGSHVGSSLPDLFAETAWPTRETETN
jgi:hypothetical protein